MSVSPYVSARSARVADTLSLIPAYWTLVLTAIAIAQVVMVQAGILPWALSEIDPTILVP